MSKAPERLSQVDVQEFTVKQPRYDVWKKLPIYYVVLGPRGSGETVLPQNMISDMHKD